MSSTATTAGPDFSSSQAWDASANSLIRLMAKFENPSISAYQQIFKRLDDYRAFSTATTILDIGCGSGLGITALSKYIKLGPGVSILAIDFSPEMINHVLDTKRKMLSAGKSEIETWAQVEAKVMDVSEMHHIATGTISHAFANFVLFGVEDSGKALEEIFRVLEPNGVFAMTSFRRVEWIDCMSLMQEVTDQMLSFPKYDPSNRWANPEGVKTSLEAAGFHDTRAEEIEVELIVDDIHSFPRDMMALPALTNRLSMLSEAELEEGFQIVRNKLRNEYLGSDGRARLKAICIIGWARK